MIQPALHWFETVGSTNDVALDMARAGAPEGTVVVAGNQTKGRGRRGRVWTDEPGACVLMSLLLTPTIPLSAIPGLTFAVSLGVTTALKAASYIDPMLKWPNDVFVGNRKVAGILVESASAAGRCVVIAGIGVNANQRNFDPDLEDTATSLLLECGSCVDIRALAGKLSLSVLAEYERFLSEGFEITLERWRRYMWGIGESVQITTESQILNGVIRGVDGSGALLVSDKNGTLHAIHAADTIKTTRN